MYPFDCVVFIGRFQPFHNGHYKVLQYALQSGKKVLMLLGSSNRPRTIKNPFRFPERRDMIYSCLTEEEAQRVDIVPISDYMYNDQKWAMEIQGLVDAFTHTVENPKIGIIGCAKSEYYFDLFPQWSKIPVLPEPPLDATDIRKWYLNDYIDDADKKIARYVPEQVFGFLKQFRHTEHYMTLVKEFGYIKDYKTAWDKSPYPPTFVTVDACVIQAGHVLLVKRRAEPGKGLYALPGGFLNPNERIKTGMLRELREETRLKVPEPVLKGHIKAFKVFDHPDRSDRGRTITNAFLIQLPAGELPKVKGADDAEKAVWVPLNEIDANIMFEDHADMITYFLGCI